MKLFLSWRYSIAQIFTEPLGPLPVIPVKLTEQEEQDLIAYLVKEHDAALEAREHLDNTEWPQAVRQYNSRLTREDAKADTDSNLDMGLTYKFGRVEFAQVVGPLYRDPKQFWIVRHSPSKPNLDTSPYQRIVNFIDNVGESLATDEITYRNAQVFGYAPVKIGWTVKTQSVLEWQDIQDPQITSAPPNAIAIEQIQSAGPAGVEPPIPMPGVPGSPEGEDPGKVQPPATVTRFRALIEKDVKIWSGSKEEPIPLPDFVFPWYALSLDTAPWLTHQVWLTAQEAQEREEGGQWTEGTIEKLGDPQGDRPRNLDLGQEKKDKDGNVMPRSAGQTDSRCYQVRETYLRLKVSGHRGRKELIVTWEVPSKKIIKVVFNWLNEYRIPFNVFVREVRDDGIPGIAFAYRMKSYHLAKNALVNQRLDAATKANNKLVLIQATSDLLKLFPGGVLRAGAYATTADVSKEAKEFNLSTPFQQMEGFEELIDDEAMATAGLSPGQMGHELANRPTSGGTQTILQQAGLGQDLIRESFRRFKGKNMKMRLARYRQFCPDGLNVYMRGTNQADRDAIANMVAWPEGFIEQNVVIEPMVNSETLNLTLSRQERLQVVTSLPQIYDQMMKFAQTAATPGALSFVAERMLYAYAVVVADFFEVFDVKDRDVLVAGIIGAVNAGKAYQEALDQAQQIIQKLTAEKQQRELADAQAALGPGTPVGGPPAPGGLPGVSGLTGAPMPGPGSMPPGSPPAGPGMPA
jgi:hypothetical protein